MRRSNRKGYRRVHGLSVAALLALVAGCASTSEDRDESARDACPPGRTLICTQRLGKTESCSCELEDEFEDIFDNRDN
ncbi:MAG: hypothetical protein P8Y01_00860 [Woeseiaceae bacterium]|jgi:hypothetical protein